MPSDRMNSLKLENPATGPLHAPPRKRRFRGRHLLIGLLVAAAAFGVYRGLRRTTSCPAWWKTYLASFFSKHVESRTQDHAPVCGPGALDPFEIRQVPLHRGDTLESVVRRLHIAGLGPEDLRKPCLFSPLGGIMENDEILLVLNRADGQASNLVYLRPGGGSYTLDKKTSGWQCGADDENGAGVTAHGVWSKSFYNSCVACGLPAPLISRVAQIFSSEVDVTSDFKSGDSLSVFYEQYPVASSRGKQFLVLGAEMNVSGKVYQAFGFDAEGSWGYFDEKGGSVARPFSMVPFSLRALLNGSGGAVLKIFRPRFDTMYIVPPGVQVCAVSDGLVSSVRRLSGGRFSVEIHHGGGYSSWYGNLSALSPGLRRGASVRRSMVIGSAGSNKSAKAYFDFQFYKNGRPVNFEAEQFAPRNSVPETMRAEYAKTVAVCLSALHHDTASGKK